MDSTTHNEGLPVLGEDAERAAFQRLQARLPAMFQRLFPEPRAPRTVVVLPSLSLDPEVLKRITGVPHYEERMLCLLLLLRLPRTHVVYLSSEPIPEPVVDYYLHLLPGIPARHARARLTLLCCHDGSALPLSEKILHRPRLIERVREAISVPDAAHITCFNVSPLERRLALRLDIPIYGCDPDLLHLGSKSGSRTVFREAGVDMPQGCEGLRDCGDLHDALVKLKTTDPQLRRAVVKLNEGFSGEANAVFSFAGAPRNGDLGRSVRERLPHMAFAAKDMTWEIFEQKIDEMGAIAEAFIEGDIKRSPSVQFRVDPLANLEIISTHDQVLGGEEEQVFLGCSFPADPQYCLEIQAAGLAAARYLRDQGVLGRFGIDFVSVKQGQRWRHYAIEVNIRKGGTTHPYLMLQFLTDGAYDPEAGGYKAPGGRTCCYYASDNIEAAQYRGLSPDDLIDLAALNDLHFHGAVQEGVVFHMIGALSQFGKLGMVCVAATPEKSRRLHEQIIATLNRETANVG